MIHRVVIYLRADQTIAHVQSTNGEQWPGLIEERDQNNVLLPLLRMELEIEATQEEIDAGEHGRPRHRKAGTLFHEELEYDIPGRRVRYRAGSGQTGKITEHVAGVLPG